MTRVVREQGLSMAWKVALLQIRMHLKGGHGTCSRVGTVGSREAGSSESGPSSLSAHSTSWPHWNTLVAATNCQHTYPAGPGLGAGQPMECLWVASPAGVLSLEPGQRKFAQGLRQRLLASRALAHDLGDPGP